LSEVKTFWEGERGAREEDEPLLLVVLSGPDEEVD
jgi:hypothetical protein